MEKHSSSGRSQGKKKNQSQAAADDADISDMTMNESEDAEMHGDSQSEEGSTEQKSVGSIISQSLAKESQETIDRALTDVSTRIKAAKTYASANPGEASLIALTAALAGWVLLGTKPGRKVFDAGAERFVPEITRWVSKNFAGMTH